jgi:3D (Asp-Asp-Asp) domain-containing protein
MTTSWTASNRRTSTRSSVQKVQSWLRDQYKRVIILFLIAIFFLYLSITGERPSLYSSDFPANATQGRGATQAVEYQVFKPDSCTSGWNVTGYFTPEEKDYGIEIKVVSMTNPRTGVETLRPLSEDFLNVVKIEGWGLTKNGDYIGSWRGKYWGPSSSANDSQGNPLKIESIAVDTSVIPHGKRVMIPTLPHPWDEIIFNSTDIGPGIKGKHIDVFTGLGENAERETFRITGNDNIVCIGSVDYVRNNSA